MTQVESYCTQCGAKIEPNSKYCANCGKPTSLGAMAERAAGEAQEKTMTPKKQQTTENEKKKGRGKKLKIVVGVVIGLIILFIGVPILLSFVAPGTVFEANPEQITGITQFYVLRDGSVYNIRFSLTNAQQGIVTSDADVSFRAIAGGQELYSRAFSIKSEDFKTYQLVLTGAPIVAYAFQLNATELQPPSNAIGSSNAYLQVTLPNGKVLSTSTTYF